MNFNYMSLKFYSQFFYLNRKYATIAVPDLNELFYNRLFKVITVTPPTLPDKTGMDCSKARLATINTYILRIKAGISFSDSAGLGPNTLMGALRAL
jgi:hypothetical protein